MSSGADGFALKLNFSTNRVGELVPDTPSVQRRIGSGIALAAPTGNGRWQDNPHHWQTMILLLPLYYNPEINLPRKPIRPSMIQRTIKEMRAMFSGYTLSQAFGWYLDEPKDTGIPDELLRCEIDGIFTGNDLHLLNVWRRKLMRRFKQKYIYMKIVDSGNAI